VTPLSAAELAAACEGRLLGGGGPVDRPVTDVSVHSGRTTGSSAFFALAPDPAAALGHAAEALAAGAALAVVAEAHLAAGPAPAGAIVVVDDPLLALQRLAAWWRHRLPAFVVAVVGSNGKTVTKDALVHLAGSGLRAVGSPGSYNSRLGVPLSLLQVPADAAVAVIEAAASEPGEMAALATMVRPDGVLLTNVGSRYLAGFAHRDHQIDEMLRIAGSTDHPPTWFLTSSADAHAAAVRLLGAGVRCRLVDGGAEGGTDQPTFSEPRHVGDLMCLEVAFPGRAPRAVEVRSSSADIVRDLELAMAGAHELGIDADAILDAVDGYRPTATRMEAWRSPAGHRLVRDVATADPLAVASAVAAVEALAGSGERALVVMTDPFHGLDHDRAVGLGEAIGRTSVRAVLGLDVEAHHVVAAAARAVRPALAVGLAADGRALREAILRELGRDDVALVQASPDVDLDDLTSGFVEAMAPNRLIIDLGAVENNVRAFRKAIGPQRRLLGVVKALAYGTEAPPLARALEEAGVDWLAVSGADEGAELRRSGIRMPILVMLPTADDVERLARHDLTPVAYTVELVDAVAAEAERVGRRLALHLEVDTGMHRTGVSVEEALATVRRLADHPWVRLEGLMTHFAGADESALDAFTDRQADRFRQVLDAADAAGHTDVIRHAGATAATIRHPGTHLDMVRVGLGLYGLHPSPETRVAHLEPAISLVSRIVQVREIPEGDTVGYGCTYAAPPGGRRIAIVPAGYHDCIPRGLSNVGRTAVAGVVCPIVGIVSMDSMAIDVTDAPGARVGSEVLVYGRLGDMALPVEPVAELLGTIPYEVICKVGPRVQRVFIRH
jgi:alanine racemase